MRFAAAIIAGCCCVLGLAQAQDRGKPPDGVVERLLRNSATLPEDLKLSDTERARIVEELKVAEREASNQAARIHYLLAALGEDRENNIRWFQWTLQDCGHGIQCDEEVAGFAIDLYDRGAVQLLADLLAMSRNSDGALSAALGDFYWQAMRRSPLLVLTRLRPLVPRDQRNVCTLAAGGDGGGQVPEEREKVMRLLRDQLRSHPELSQVGKMCLAAIKSQPEASPHTPQQ